MIFRKSIDRRGIHVGSLVGKGIITNLTVAAVLGGTGTITFTETQERLRSQTDLGYYTNLFFGRLYAATVQ